MSEFILSQILIGIALLFDLSAFQFKEKRYTLYCMSMACLFIAAHFWLLGIHTAALNIGIAAVRFFVATFTRSKKLMFVFWALLLTSAFISFSGLLSVLVTTSSMITTWASFRSADRQFRLWVMLASSIMVVHNLLAWTPAGLALEIVFLTGAMVGYYRYYVRGLVSTPEIAVSNAKTPATTPPPPAPESSD